MAKRKARLTKPEYQLDIVIPVYGQPDLLQKCLDSIPAAGGGVPYRLILVDDQGPDQAALGQIYRSLNGNSNVIRNRQNSGFPRTVNTGVAVGSAPFILLLNTDIELLPGAITAMLAEFSVPAAGVVGPKLLFPPDSVDPTRPAGKIQHAGLTVNFRGQVVHAHIGWRGDHPAANERKVCQAVTGACMMIRRRAWVDVLAGYRKSGDQTSGALNEVYGKGTYEDVEFCFAARSVGYQVIYQPAAVAYHHVGASVKDNGGGYPLGRNELIFRARCGELLAWDEFRF